MSDARRAFYQHSRAWYAASAPLPEGTVEEVMFGLYHEDGSTAGEMAMRWRRFGNGQVVARLEAFDDSWAVLGGFGDVVGRLAELGRGGVAPERFCEILKECGFRDRTPTANPRRAPAALPAPPEEDEPAAGLRP